MASEVIAQLPMDSSVGLANGAQLVVVNNAKGIGFPPPLNEPFTSVAPSAYFRQYVPATAALGTGFTLKLLVADDLDNPSVGKLVTFDVQYAQDVSGTNTDLDASFTGTHDVTQLTSAAVAGANVAGTITSVIAHAAGSPAASTWVLVRIRRSNGSTDTHTGRAVLLGAMLLNT